MQDVPIGHHERRGPSKWTIEAALLLVQFGMGLGFLSPAPLFPLIIDEYDVSRAAASLLVGGTSLGVALALVPASILPARIGTRWAVTLGGVLLASMLLTPLANSFAMLLVLRILFSLGAAVLLSALPAVVVRWFEPRELALVNGLGIVAQTLGVATSMSVAASIAAVVGWHLTLTLFAAVVGSATVVWVVMSSGAANDAGGAAALSMRDIRDVAGDRLTVLLGLGFAGALGANISFASWLPTYYQEQFAFSLERAGQTASVLTIFGMIGSLLGSVLPMRFPRRKPFLLLAGLLMPVAGVGCFLGTSNAVLLPSLALFGVATSIFIPVMMTIPMEASRIGPARAGVAVSVILGAGNFSGFVVPLLVGTARDVSGTFVFGLAIAGCLALALAVSALVIPETGPVLARPAQQSA
ncbi:MAG: MFS transporter [Chloroflexota bacterium]